MQTKHIAPIVLGVLLVGGLSFYGGTLYAKTKTGAPNFQRGQANGQFRVVTNGQGGQGGSNRFGTGGFTTGEIVSKDDKSMTVKLGDAGSKIVFFSASTTVSKMTDGAMEDLRQGTNVMVSGTPNADGSVTASMIQIRPDGDRGIMPVRTGQDLPQP